MYLERLDFLILDEEINDNNETIALENNGTAFKTFAADTEVTDYSTETDPNLKLRHYRELEPYLPEVVKCYTGVVQFYCYDLENKNINLTETDFIGYRQLPWDDTGNSYAD